jgi:pyruvate dehydrogenase E1 component alpha subunit
VDRADLIAFKEEVGRRFDAGEIHGPVHLCSETQIEPLIEIFKTIKRTDWVLATWRAHFHALLHGVPREQVMGAILAGRSMMLHFPAHRIMSSAIMGGMLPIACGLAAGGERVWCFVGDMCASTGAFQDAVNFGHGFLNFIIEDNGLSTNTPTVGAWGTATNAIKTYVYKRTTNHYQPLPDKGGF